MAGKKVYMAVDQYGQTFHGLTNPRKELCERLANSHADNMYVDGKDGKRYHVGYFIGGLWLTLYVVTPYRREVGNA